MPQMLLTEEAIFPSENILQAALGDIYPVYRAFFETLEAAQVTMEWRYYKDSKAWLCKCQHKKKTVFWLSIWEGFFKATFFFTEAAYEGVKGLPFDEQPIREKNVGRSVPVVMEMCGEGQLGDFELLVAYKKSLK